MGGQQQQRYLNKNFTPEVLIYTLCRVKIHILMTDVHMIWIKIEILSLPPYVSAQVPLASNSTFSSNVCFERPPSILVPLKVHSPPKGYQLYMTCAVRGCPTPSVSWYLNNVCINSDKNYYITNSCGVCSMYILRVQPTDNGEYKVVALNSLGTAECAAKIIVKGKRI